MPDKYFLSVSGGTGAPLDLDGERVLWRGHCAVAQYAFEEPASLPRWTLPEGTEVVLTDQRAAYVHAAIGATGELSWPWPQHLRVQPGNRATGRAATVTQIQLVCAGPDGAFPALVFAGGDLATVGDADRLANVLRQAIARYRVERSGTLGLSPQQVRMLSRLVIGPEFSNYQGGEGQTVTLLGSVPAAPPVVPSAPAAAPDPLGDPFLGEYFGPENDYAPPYAPSLADSESGYVAADPRYADYSPTATVYGTAVTYGPDADTSEQPYYEPVPLAPPVFVTPPVSGRPFPAGDRPGYGADENRARQARDAEEAAQPDLASRAADLAARVASLVSAVDEYQQQPLARFETETTNLSAFLQAQSAHLGEGEETTLLSAFAGQAFPAAEQPAFPAAEQTRPRSVG